MGEGEAGGRIVLVGTAAMPGERRGAWVVKFELSNLFR